MGYSLSTQIIGTEELQRAFDRSPSLVASELRNALASVAFNVEAKAKQYAPVQYGGLRGSIHTEGPSSTGINVEAKVGTNIKYAPFQEFGTGPITPKRAKMLVWKKGGKLIFAKRTRGVPGRFFFKKAREESIPLANSIFSSALGSIIGRLARGG